MMLKNKVALVTGGTSGIGRATATLAVSAEQRAFVAAGAKVMFSGRRNAEGEKTAKLIRETGAELQQKRSGSTVQTMPSQSQSANTLSTSA
jgi:NAD(P)-dependent dehydrogenase (short-subunit alcohol dehydrogenase family)